MNEGLLTNYFSSCKIEYFSVLKYSDCRESAPRIIKRAGFEPRSVIIYLLPYYTGECENISRYAASVDYHLAINEINDGLCKLLKSEYPSAEMKGYGDHSPIDERHAALVAGLGVAGKNGLILNKTYGSFVFIGDMITDIPPEELSATEPLTIEKCIGCGACLKACPTGILRSQGEACLSAVTQKKGELTEEEARLMRENNTLWGCDACQSVCPYNRERTLTPIDFFYRERIFALTPDLLSSMDDEAFSRRAFAWRGRATVERNVKLLFGEK